MQDQFEQRERVRSDFVTQFVPEGVRSGHDLLFDFSNPSDYAPGRGELDRCLRGYLDLLRAVPPDAPWEVMSMCMMDASELVLSLLCRATPPDRERLARDTTGPLVAEIDLLLSGVEQSSQRSYDAYKRMRAISKVLRGPPDGEKSPRNLTA